MASAEAAALQDVLTVRGAHPDPEPVRLAALAAVRLECPFHLAYRPPGLVG